MRSITTSMVKISRSLRLVSEALKKVSHEIESHAKSQKKAPTTKKTMARKKGLVGKKVTTKLKSKKALTRPTAKKKTAPAKKTIKAKVVKVSATVAVLDVIKDAANGANVSILKEKTGFNERKIANCVYRLKKQGVIKTTGRGVYSVA